MAGSSENTRRSDEAGRVRQIASSEVVAFATTAGSMMLGLIAAEAGEHGDRSAADHAPAQHPPPRPAHLPDAVAPPPPDVGTGHGGPHAGAPEEPLQAAPPMHAALASHPLEAASSDIHSGIEASAAHSLITSLPVWHFEEPQDHRSGLDAGAAPAGADLGTAVHSLTDAVTGVVDTSLAALTSTIANVGTTVGHLVSSLSGAVGDLAGNLLGTAAGHDGSLAETVPSLAGDVLGLASGLTAADHGHAGGVPLIDTADTVPVPLLHALPLQLGFLGQPTIDGHEGHDGAFSALGLHHF